MAERKLEIDELRRQMALVDARIVALLDERARAARHIGELRRDQAAVLPLGDRAVLDELVTRSSGDMPPEALRAVLRTVYAECFALEQPVHAVCVGEVGGPAFAAMRARFGGVAGPGSLTATQDAGEAFEAVARRRAEFAVAPLENSSEGLVPSTISALVASDLRIVEMLEMSLDLVLSTRTGNLAGVDRVLATPADHARCRSSLSTVLPHAAFTDVPSPAEACATARENDAVAAIALESMAVASDLLPARRGILDTTPARLRLGVVGTRPSGRAGRDVSAFVFTVREGAGALLDVLGVFAERGIPLTKLYSQPAQAVHSATGDPWSYLFFGEAVGHFTDRPLVTAFEEVKRTTRSFKLLGSYPAP